MRRTPLFSEHNNLGGKLIDFGGWELPVQYSGIIQEHEAVRTHAGLFDVSHMGEITVNGPRSEEFVQTVVTNDISRMQDGQVMYSLMCYPDGGVVDDLLIYRYDRMSFLLVVNAANADKDYAWLEEHAIAGAALKNVSDDYAQLALQGPSAQDVLQQLTDRNLAELRFFRFWPSVEIAGATVLVSRTGYTGEDGFELYLKPADAVRLWQQILRVGAPLGVVPVGLGARDTLRFEAGLPLYGQEIARDITPLEAGLQTFVKFSKHDFVGKAALVEQQQQGTPRKTIGLVMLDKGVPRSGYEVYANDESIGRITTGSYAPSLKQNAAYALVASSFSGEEVSVEIRGKRLRASVVPAPLYSKKYRK